MQQHYFPSPTDLLPPFPSSLSSWLHAAGRGTTRDRRLILSRVNRRDRFRVPARREAAARYWPRFFHVLHASVQTPGDWKVGGRWRKWNRVDFSPSLSLCFSSSFEITNIFVRSKWKEFFDIIGKVNR